MAKGIQDPTKTLTLRRQAISNINQRFGELARLVTQTVEKNNALGLVANEAADSGRFIYKFSDEKIAEFDVWLKEQIDAEIFDNIKKTQAERLWLNGYMGVSYQRGMNKTRVIFDRAFGKPEQPFTIPLSIFSHPSHTERAGIIFTRVYSDLRGVTDAMAAQMTRVLSEGMLAGHSPIKVSKALVDRVNKIGRTRARLIARTEIVHAHHIAQLTEGDRIEAEVGEVVNYEWNTSKDELVRSTHRTRHGRTYTKRAAMGLIGEPNCRCGLIPTLKPPTK